MSLEDHNVTAVDVSQILKNQILLRDPKLSYLAEIEIDPDSLIVTGTYGIWMYCVGTSLCISQDK